MRYISLNTTGLSYFISKGRLSELSGSSKYNVFDKEIVMKEKQYKPKFENKSCLTEMANTYITDNLSAQIVERFMINLFELGEICYQEKFTNTIHLNRYEFLYDIVKSYAIDRIECMYKKSIITHEIEESNCRYKTVKRKKSGTYKINKSKIKGKMNALFNLSPSRKFIAFYSVSFPLDIPDSEAFVCWNYWLTDLRKRFNLTNYIWVTERQKNGTLHYHMLTNNWLPIQIINRSMAIIINNRTLTGAFNWGSSSLDRYNGVDVDSIYNSKRHKKTGKSLNPTQVRDWISKYITKYVTKNTESFTHLCWHCSRSVSLLFTSTIILFQERDKVLMHLPMISSYYTKYTSDFNTTFVFHFVPPDHLFNFIHEYNNMISVEYEPQRKFNLPLITYKTYSL